MKHRACTKCGKPIILVPSAEKRARADVTNKTAGYYRGLFTMHAECQLSERQAATLELIKDPYNG